ncbi:MAG: division/cell wall cluster transcriptional repressor MraZ [bacterium]
MDYFIGTYEYSLDDKNRLSIPSKIRKVIAELFQNKCMLTKFEDGYLTLYPYDIWQDRFGNRAAKLPRSNDDAKRLRRLLGMNSMEASLDTQGRIAVPTEYCQHAGIKKKVLILGCMDEVQIWSPKRYQEVSQSPEERSAKEELKKFGF